MHLLAMESPLPELPQPTVRPFHPSMDFHVAHPKQEVQVLLQILSIACGSPHVSRHLTSKGWFLVVYWKVGFVLIPEHAAYSGKMKVSSDLLSFVLTMAEKRWSGEVPVEVTVTVCGHSQFLEGFSIVLTGCGGHVLWFHSLGCET